MKCKTIILLLLFNTAFLQAQTIADWIDLEIESKRRSFEKRWELSKTLAVSNRNDYDVGYYGLNLNIDISNEVISGLVTIRGKSRIANLAHIDLDFYNNMDVLSVSGNADSFSHSNNILTLNLEAPINTSEVFEICIQYEGTPQQGGFMGFNFADHNGVPVVSTLSEPYFARTWFPCKDLPEDKADSADIIVTVPDTLIAVSNGTLIEVRDNGDRTYTYFWEERYPIANYLISLAISNYTHWEDTYVGLDSTLMPVEYWVYPEYAQSAEPNLSLTPQMIDYFSELWGEYPFILEKYGQAQFAWGGGMEHQTCTSLGGFSELLICHELAHQWWGDMVTCANWHHIWLNEGFARYSEALWQEHKYGKDGLVEYMKMLNRPQYWQPGTIFIMDTSSVSSIFNRIVYDKGAWTLHMLRKVLSEETFWNIFPTYREEYYMGVAKTEDFKNICEEVSGKDLDWFFEQWIYGEGQPYYQVLWIRVKIGENRWSVKVSISQIQTTSTVFSMPLDIFIETIDRDTIFTIWDSLSVQEFNFECYSKPINIIIDPDNWVLKNITYSMIDPDLGYIPTDFFLSEPYPNPFNGLTHFKLFLPHDIEGNLSVYDILGRKIDVIESGKLEAGYYTKEWSPLSIPSGLYIIRLEGESIYREKKVIYIK